MSAHATIPAMAETAITALFERTINDTRLFWEQRPDGSFACFDWEWCCPEIPAVLAGLEAVVFATRESSQVRLVARELIVISLESRRLWGEHRVLRKAPRGITARTWDDRLEVRI